MTRESRARMSAAHVGKLHPDDVKQKIAAAHRGKKFSLEHRQKLSAIARKRVLSVETRRRMSIARMGNQNSLGKNAGPDNWNWNGGSTSLHHKIRNSPAYKRWRTHVFQRDDYTCQSCSARGVYLEADHELPFAYFPDLRFEILNGRTLCRPCHKRTPTYGENAKHFFI